MMLIEISHQVERVALHFGVDAFWIGYRENGIALAAEIHALVDRRQKAAAPERCPAAGAGSARREDDEGRQIGRFAPQAIADPRAHAGPAELRRAGVHEDLPRRVIEL